MRHRRPGTPAALLAAGLLTLCGTLTLLAGCAPPEVVEAAPVTVTATVTTTATATVTVTPAPPLPDPAAPPPPAAPDSVPNAAAPVYEWGPAVDEGPITGASNAPELDGGGEPERYVIVAGDSFFDVAQRFNLPQQQLLRMNPQIYDYGETVYIGQVINLDWEKSGIG